LRSSTSSAARNSPGFSLTSDQAISDTLVDSLVISGNESIVADRLTELLTAGLDEVMVSLVPQQVQVMMMSRRDSCN
jgi:hypothetical protein